MIAWIGCRRPPQHFLLECDHTFWHTASMPSAERVTVTLPANLVEQIDRVERNRSRFIAEAVEHELVRRQRQALLRSIANPHPETTALTGASLADWTGDLPADEKLVNDAAGTPVRWVEGTGWIREPQ
jgi:hypothetical protein